MAFTTFVLIVTFMGITSAAFFGEPNNNGFPGFQMPRNPFHFGPVFNPFNFHIPWPRMPVIPHPNIPSEEDIIKMKPLPGQTYSGAYASSIGGKGKIALNVNGHVLTKEFENSQAPEGSKS